MDNFWWLEIGGLADTIGDAESIRDELMKVGYGVWDYIKNHHPMRADAENWTLEWMGSLPGKRENRRYVGDHILTQNDVRAGGTFDDIITYGGWSMDDHHPAGLLYPGKPTIFHPAPSPFGIPYRCICSKDVTNLMFAGRNISTTHAALSATRVMGTTSLLGQAAGTAAAMCICGGCDPAELGSRGLGSLQQRLLDDDQWLPGLRREVSELTAKAKLAGSGCLDVLRNGYDRPIGEQANAWEGAAGDAISFAWQEPVMIGGLRLVFDSDLNEHKRMPCSIPLKGNRCGVPATMVRKYRVEVPEGGSWRTIYREEDNYQRLVRMPLAARTSVIRIVPEQTWGLAVSRIYSIDVMQGVPERIGVVPDGEPWTSVVARVPAEDLAEAGLEREVLEDASRKGPATG